MKRLAALAVIATSVCAATWSEGAVPAADDPAAWSGVTELVTADIDASGAVSGTPSQQTLVTATGSSVAEVGVPMSSSGLERVGPGEPPEIVDDNAQFSFDLDGTESQAVTSDFARPLPVTITPSYQLDGEPVAPAELESSLADLKGEASVLTVSYEIVNVTTQTTTVTYTDGSGVDQTEEVTLPVPLAGLLSLTFPRDASAIDAPGAALAPSPSGVGASWTLALAPPLSPATQTISYSMSVKAAEIPAATVALAVIVPSEPANTAVPAQVGAAVSSAKSEVQAKLAEAQAQLAASLDQVAADLAALGQSQASGSTRDNDASDAHSSDVARQSDDELTSLGHTIDSTATSGRAAMAAAAAQVRDALDGVQADLADQSAQLSLHASQLDTLKEAVDGLAVDASDLVALIAQHKADAIELQGLVAVSIASVDLLPDHGSPQWVQVAADLAAAQAKADAVVTAVTTIAETVDQLAATVQELVGNVATAVAKAHALDAAEAAIHDGLTTIVAAAQDELSAAIEDAADGVAGLTDQVDQARSNVDRKDRDGATRSDTARRETETDVSASEKTVGASLDAVKASVQTKAAEATAAYVQLLGLSQIGLANRLPGGDATGATVQSGSFLLNVAGSERGPA